MFGVSLSGIYRNAEEEAVVMETAGSEAAPPLPEEGRDGQRSVPERVCVCLYIQAVAVLSCMFYSDECVFGQVACVRLQLSAHSWFCERRFGPTGTAAVPDAPTWRSSCPPEHGTDDCWWSDGSITSTRAHQPSSHHGTGPTGQNNTQCLLIS